MSKDSRNTSQPTTQTSSQPPTTDRRTELLVVQVGRTETPPQLPAHQHLEAHLKQRRREATATDSTATDSTPPFAEPKDFRSATEDPYADGASKTRLNRTIPDSRPDSRFSAPELSPSDVLPPDVGSPDVGSNEDNDLEDDFDADLFPARKRKRSKRNWRFRIFFPDASECLREHPEFDLDSSSSAVTTCNPLTSYLTTHSILESDREELFCLELLRIFRQRLYLVASLGILILPLFAFIYMYLSPDAWKNIVPIQAVQLVLCLIVRFLAGRTPSLLWTRLLSLVAYAMFCMGAALVVAQANSDPLSNTNKLVAYAGFNHILLSLLLLPYSVWENLVVVLIALGSLTWATWLTAGFTNNTFYVSQLFTLSTASVFIICIAHFQNVLRRRAYDAVFDLAYNAARLQMLSTSDQLTGGHNRRYMERTLSYEIARAARFAHPLSVMMFDLDNFKQVNDTLGHRAGDEVLQEVWSTATATVREIDSVARYGGDEFTVILPETHETDAYHVAERLLHTATERLQSRFGTANVQGQVTLSIGLVTLYLSAPIPAASILDQADHQLYEAKRAGKNSIALSIVPDNAAVAP